MSARREAKVAARLANEIAAFERSSGERVPIGAYGFVISAGTVLGQGVIAVSFRAIHLVENGRETHQLPVEHMGRQEDVDIARLELEGPRGVVPRNVVAVKVNESARDADTWLLGSNQGADVLDDLLFAVRTIIARRDDPSL